MTTTSRAIKTAAAAVLSVAVLTACGGGAGPTGRTGADVAKDNGTATSAPTGTPTAPPPTSIPTNDAGPTDDAVFAAEKLVAELGVANAGLLDPALDSRDELLAPARVILTADALARYTATLPADGKPETTSLDDGAAWQLVSHTTCQPEQGDTTCTIDKPVTGPLSVKETVRTEREDGGVDVQFTAEVELTSVRLADKALGTSKFTREYVVTFQPSERTDGPKWLVDAWAGTRTTTTDFDFGGK